MRLCASSLSRPAWQLNRIISNPAFNEAFFRQNVVSSRENGAKCITRDVRMTCDNQSRATSFTMQPTTYKAKAYSAASEKSPLASMTISRRDPTERDVQIEILFCGICHSDLHSV